jgi:hypothetical protein
VQQANFKASTMFYSALHELANHDWPVLLEEWDEVCPDCLFLSIRVKVTLHPSLAVMFPP